jgi:hypothetical protein
VNQSESQDEDEEEKEIWATVACSILNIWFFICYDIILLMQSSKPYFQLIMTFTVYYISGRSPNLTDLIIGPCYAGIYAGPLEVRAIGGCSPWRFKPMIISLVDF